MILQPLFENAIKHGVYESTETINVILEGNVNETDLQLSLTNDYDKEAKQTKGEGIGLKNTRERLFLIYKQNNLLSINKSESTYQVSIKIPQND